MPAWSLFATSLTLLKYQRCLPALVDHATPALASGNLRRCREPCRHSANVVRWLCPTLASVTMQDQHGRLLSPARPSNRLEVSPDWGRSTQNPLRDVTATDPDHCDWKPGGTRVQ